MRPKKQQYNHESGDDDHVENEQRQDGKPLVAASVEVNRALIRARKKFDKLDINQNGLLEGDELLELAEWVWSSFHPGGEPLSGEQQAAEVIKLMGRLDEDADGVMSFDEFGEWFEKTCASVEKFRRGLAQRRTDNRSSASSATARDSRGSRNRPGSPDERSSPQKAAVPQEAEALKPTSSSKNQQVSHDSANRSRGTADSRSESRGPSMDSSSSNREAGSRGTSLASAVKRVPSPIKRNVVATSKTGNTKGLSDQQSRRRTSMDKYKASMASKRQGKP